MSRLTLPDVDAPSVSILMVTYGNWDLTWRALHELVENTEPCFETVVVDNASPDDTAARLREETKGARLVFNDVNRGFGPASNQAAALAKAPDLLFLNTDAFVHEGWLPPLLHCLRDESVGAAGPMFLHPNGRLQEAGSVLFREGLTHAVGDGQDWKDDEYRFPRFTDYVSGACLLVRRQAFEQVGGFAPLFQPAYFEDADLCLRLWRAGWKVRYEPRSVVTHVRGGSSPTAEAKALYAKNSVLFAERWKDLLSHRPPFTLPDRGRRRRHFTRDVLASSRILVISELPPGPNPESEDATAFRLLNELAAGWPDCRISALSPGAPRDRAAVERLLASGVEVAVGVESPGWWLNERRFHYDVVIYGGGKSARLHDPAVRAWQPQAEKIENAHRLSGKRLVEALADAGVAPPALAPLHVAPRSTFAVSSANDVAPRRKDAPMAR
jgi:GT2 family glycosyltransferase